MQVFKASKAHPKIFLQLGLEYKYMPLVAKLIDIVKSDALGRVKIVAIRVHRFPLFIKKLPFIYLILYVQNWNQFNSNTGRTLVHKCCHFFDLMNLIIGATPVHVMAFGLQDVNHHDENYNGNVFDILDNAYVIVEYDDSVQGMLDLCIFAKGGKNEEGICVVGKLGKVVEAFVSESIVCFGTHVGGRRGVQQLKFHDHRIN
ncbi:hypothetical protein L7F22_012485 [Adiantum nelumboides]|nr:hypothetical protein [Adiantum nelumboides]